MGRALEMGVGEMAACEADVEMTSMGIISSSPSSALVSSPPVILCSSLLSVITSHSRIAHHHIGGRLIGDLPNHHSLSSAWNVYSNNQTYGVIIPIDLCFLINRTDRNVCDARNDRSR